MVQPAAGSVVRSLASPLFQSAVEGHGEAVCGVWHRYAQYRVYEDFATAVIVHQRVWGWRHIDNITLPCNTDGGTGFWCEGWGCGADNFLTSSDFHDAFGHAHPLISPSAAHEIKSILNSTCWESLSVSSCLIWLERSPLLNLSPVFWRACRTEIDNVFLGKLLALGIHYILMEQKAVGDDVVPQTTICFDRAGSFFHRLVLVIRLFIHRVWKIKMTILKLIELNDIFLFTSAGVPSQQLIFTE